ADTVESEKLRLAAVPLVALNELQEMRVERRQATAGVAADGDRAAELARDVAELEDPRAGIKLAPQRGHGNAGTGASPGDDEAQLWPEIAYARRALGRAHTGELGGPLGGRSKSRLHGKANLFRDLRFQE